MDSGDSRGLICVAATTESAAHCRASQKVPLSVASGEEQIRGSSETETEARSSEFGLPTNGVEDECSMAAGLPDVGRVRDVYR